MGEQHAIDCSDDFTRLAFDTIGLCAFGYVSFPYITLPLRHLTHK